MTEKCRKASAAGCGGHVPRAGTAFDRRRVQAVDVQLVADLFQQAQFRLGQLAVCGGHVAGQGIGRLMQPLGQVGADQAEQRIQPVLLLEQFEDQFGHALHAVDVVFGKDRQVVDAWIFISSAVRIFASEAETAIIVATRQSWVLSTLGSVRDKGASFLRGLMLRCRILTGWPRHNR